MALSASIESGLHAKVAFHFNIDIMYELVFMVAVRS